jgi:hypothetical protein
MAIASTPPGGRAALPRWESILVPCLLAANVAALYFGLTSEFITVKKSLTFWGFPLFSETNTVSMLSGACTLLDEGSYVIFALVFVFSVVFPIVKVALLAGLHLARAGHQRWFPGLMQWLVKLGPWSLLDVMVVAVLIVVVRLRELMEVELLPGFYCFLAAVLLSVVNSALIKRAARAACLPAFAS